MLELGVRQILTIIKEVDFGVYLAENKGDADTVLLPKKQVPEEAKVGDEIEVFLYKDSKDRLIATTSVAKLEIGQVAVLPVIEVGQIGAFLNWGLEKDLLLPFKEQTKKVQEGESHIVTLYIDKSERLCASMKVYDYLRCDSPYKQEDLVQGRVYEISPLFGAYIAVDDQFSAMISPKESFADLKVGEIVEARVRNVKEDGKLDLTIREKAYLQMDADAKAIMDVIESYEGKLPFNDKASPELIKQEVDMSKNAFKRAVGRLLKEGKVEITQDGIHKI